MVSQLHIDWIEKEMEVGYMEVIYVREDITSRMLTKHKFPDDTEALFIEINFQSEIDYFVYYITHLLNLINTFLII